MVLHLRVAREAAGISLSALAGRTHFSRGHLSNVETGKRRMTGAVIAAYERALGELAGDSPRPGSWDETICRLREQWRLLVRNDREFGPGYALIGVTTQLTLLSGLLRDVPEALRPDLLRIAAQYAESSAWLNQSLNNDGASARWTAMSLTWAEEIEDPVMTAWATYRDSQHWLMVGDAERAVERASVALHYDRQLPGPMRAALRVQKAHVLAERGDHREAMHLLDEAHRWAADRGRGKPEGEHGSYCTGGYIEVYRSACLGLAKRPNEAVAVLDAVLPSITAGHPYDFLAALVGKATAHVAARQPELAAATALRALPIARQAGSRRILLQLAQVGRAMAEHGQLADVRAFLDDLTVIT